MGYSGARYDVNLVDVTMTSSAGSIQLVRGGAMPEFSEEEALKILSPEEITAEVELHQGNVEATAWGCDLTYDYVKINADYRS
jgi:glutamate N-acetyltransferase/amino-acid N-acetyltransferase